MIQFAVFSLIIGLSFAYGDYHSIDVPIKSYNRGLKVIRTPSYSEKHLTEVKISPSDMPVHMTFNSQTSPVYVDQKHKKSKGSYKKSESMDEPHKLVHHVIKPVYQEIVEIIKPYRKVVQVIKPVEEERMTKVYKHGDSEKYGEEENRGYKMKGVFQNLDIDKEYLQR